MPKTSDRRIVHIEKVAPPEEFFRAVPSNQHIEDLVLATRKAVSDILHGRDRRLLIVVGPCSIHDVKAACEYGEKLRPIREKLKDRVEIVMRVYFEKPRTTVGWKGLINIVDTGASMTVLSYDLAIELGLLSGAQVSLDTVNTAGGAVQVNRTHVEEIRAGSAVARNVPVAIHDLPNRIPGISGLLGMSFLNRFKVTLDAEREVLHLDPRQ